MPHLALRRSQTAAAPPPAVAVTRHGLVGLAGSVLLALGAFGIGYLPPRSRVATLPIVSVLRTTTTGAILAKGFVLAGTVLLLLAWLMLGSDVRENILTSPARLTRMFWWWCIPLVLAPPLFSQDLYSYVAQGNLLRLGYDPYHHGVASVPGPFLESVSSFWLDTPAPYGPFFLSLCRGVVALTGDHVYIAALLLRAVAMVGVWLLAHYLPQLARVCNVDARWAIWFGLANPLILMHFVSGAHNDALMIGLVVAGLALAMQVHYVWGAFFVSIAGTVKAPALVALGFVGLIWAGRGAALPRRMAAWLQCGAIGVVVFIAVNLASGVGFGWVRALNTPGVVRSWISPTTAFGMAIGDTLHGFGGPDVTTTLIAVMRIGGFMIALGVTAWLLLWPGERQPVRGAGLALLTLAVLGPVVQPWYLLWGAVLLAAGGMTRREMRIGVILTALLVIQGLAQSSGTDNSLLRVPDASAAIIAIGVALLAILVPRRSREELFGNWDDAVITLPETVPR
jgi:alpha-1,6-mannosyltransferase